jgi:hypothetical protein
MSRRPTDRYAAWAWWRAAVAGESAEWPMTPRCGFYKLKRAGRWVPAVIDLAQVIDTASGDLVADERITCMVGGLAADPDETWTRLRPISEADFHMLAALPVGAIDLSRTPIQGA